MYRGGLVHRFISSLLRKAKAFRVSCSVSPAGRPIAEDAEMLRALGPQEQSRRTPPEMPRSRRSHGRQARGAFERLPLLGTAQQGTRTFGFQAWIEF